MEGSRYFSLCRINELKSLFSAPLQPFTGKSSPLTYSFQLECRHWLSIEQRYLVGVSHPRLAGNEAECLEVNPVGIPDYSMCCLIYNRVNPGGQSNALKAFQVVYVTSLSLKCEKCQRSKQRTLFWHQILPARYVRP